jgi:hypothetical protein
MAIPDYQTLMLSVLRLAAKGEQRVGVAPERIADELGPAFTPQGLTSPLFSFCSCSKMADASAPLS